MQRHLFQYLIFDCLVIALLAVVSLGSVNAAEQVTFSSSNKQTLMVELFTSQGCSSCPPAERWLNTLVDNKQLWQDIVPIAFHVDYWDRLGWPDPYASRAYSNRQYRHQQQNHIRSVYTPGVIVNGKEWRGWIRGEGFPQGNANAGILSVVLNTESMQVNFSEASNNSVLNVVLLGVGITTQVKKGENRGKHLEQEFVALSHDSYSASQANESGRWKLPLPLDERGLVKRHALAVWVSRVDNIAPIQSTGQWVPSAWVSAQ